jgi:hypothetical protein
VCLLNIQIQENCMPVGNPCGAKNHNKQTDYKKDLKLVFCNF